MSDKDAKGESELHAIILYNIVGYGERVGGRGPHLPEPWVMPMLLTAGPHSWSSQLELGMPGFAAGRGGCIIIGG